jgi:hypothetical protein
MAAELHKTVHGTCTIVPYLPQFLSGNRTYHTRETLTFRSVDGKLNNGKILYDAGFLFFTAVGRELPGIAKIQKKGNSL